MLIICDMDVQPNLLNYCFVNNSKLCFRKFDVEQFYSSITKPLMIKAIEFARLSMGSMDGAEIHDEVPLWHQHGGERRRT